MLKKKKIKITVLGMGYVGLPLAYEFGKYYDTIGFDISNEKILNLKNNINFGNILNLKNKKIPKKLKLSNNQSDLSDSDFFILCLPTPINYKKKPDLKILLSGITDFARSTYLLFNNSDTEARFELFSNSYCTHVISFCFCLL